MKYYTPISVLHAQRLRGRRGASWLFFDTDADVCREEALISARVLFEPRMQHTAAYPVLLIPVLCGTHHGLVVSSTFIGNPVFPHNAISNVPPAGDYTFIADLKRTDSPQQDVDVAKNVRDCVAIERVAYGCPCPLAVGRDTSTPCGERTIYANVDVVPLERLLRGYDEYAGDTGTPYPMAAGGFRYLASRYLTGEHFDGQPPLFAHMDFNTVSIKDLLDKGRISAAQGAATRKFKRDNCSACAFSDAPCLNNAIAANLCSGPKTEEHVRAHNNRYYLHDLNGAHGADHFGGHFTVEQRNFLLCTSGMEDFKAHASKISSRVTYVMLGRFLINGSFRVFASVGDKKRSQDFPSWATLTAALPELQALFDSYPIPAFSDETIRRARLLSYKTRETRKAAFGMVSFELGTLCISHSGTITLKFRSKRGDVHGGYLVHADTQLPDRQIHTIIYGEGCGYYVDSPR